MQGEKNMKNRKKNLLLSLTLATGFAVQSAKAYDEYLADEYEVPEQTGVLSTVGTVMSEVSGFVVDRISSVEGGVETMKDKIRNDGSLTGFIKISGNAYDDFTDNDEKESLLPFTVKINENDELDVSVGVMSVDFPKISSVSKVDILKYQYIDRRDQVTEERLGSEESWKVIDFRMEPSLLSGDNAYLSAVIGGSAGRTRYTFGDKGNETELDQLTASGELGLGAGMLIGNKNRIYGYVVYQSSVEELYDDEEGNTTKYDTIGHREGIVTEAGYSRALKNNKEFHVYYKGDYRNLDLVDSQTGEVLDAHRVYNAPHTLNFEFKF